jgi:hypothetical protein
LVKRRTTSRPAVRPEKLTSRIIIKILRNVLICSQCNIGKHWASIVTLDKLEMWESTYQFSFQALSLRTNCFILELKNYVELMMFEKKVYNTTYCSSHKQFIQWTLLYTRVFMIFVYTLTFWINSHIYRKYSMDILIIN